MTVPNSMTVGDMEFNKFQEDSDEKVAVNVVGATRNAEGVELSSDLKTYFSRQEAHFACVEDLLFRMVCHLRIVTGMGDDDYDSKY